MSETTLAIELPGNDDLEIYTEVPSAATREALRKLGQWLEDTQT